MTDNTTYREKGRALFLAALMVLSVVAMSTALVGGAAAVDKTNLDGQIYFAGQEVDVTGLSGDPVQLRQVDGDSTTHIRNINTDNGSITLDTSGLDGTYVIRDDAGDSGEFEVTEQNVEFAFEADKVDNDESTTLNFETDNRAETVNLTVNADGDLSGDELVDIFNSSNFDAETTDEDDEARIVGASLNDEIDADFSGVDAGNYTFNVNVEDTTASDTAEIVVEQADELSIDFDQNTYQETVGDEVDIGLDLTATDEVYLDVSYDGGQLGTINVTNIDADDDEDLTLVLNTYYAMDDDMDAVELVNEDGDEVDADIDSTFNIGDSPFPALDYELEAYDSDAREDEVDAAVMILDERSTDGISTHVAPTNLSIDDDAEDFLNHSTERDYVASGDYLITQVDVSGVYGYMLDDGDWNGSAHGIELDYEQTNVGPFGDEQSFNMSDLDGNVDYQIHEDPDGDTFYVIFNTADLENLDGVDSIEGDQTWDATFTVSSDNHFVAEDEDEEVSTEFDVEDRNVEIVGDFNDDDQLEVSNSAESQISAETNVAPGTPGSYYLRFQTEVLNGDLTVSDDGMLTTTLDLSDREAGEELRTVRLSESDAEHEVEGVIVEGDGSGEEEKDSVDLDVADPGEITVGEDAEFDVTVTNNKDEEVTTTITFEFDGESEESELTIGADSSASETFTVSDLEEGDYSWSVSDSDFELSDSGTLTVAGDGEDNKTEDNKTEDDSTETEDDSTEDDSTEDDSDDDGQPGFGVAVAIVALLAAAMLALRRQN
ncbi:BGTF surface domain-containing protein [Halomontanus rarus]|uniref:BGTF surface domain-containing protein n=1 Tax=Halomontanus rarus TaxID=3034020 RepID=UPI00307CBBB3